MTRTRAILFSVTMVVGTYVALELIAFAGLEILRRVRPIHDHPAQLSMERYRDYLTPFISGNTHYYRFRSTLGWDIKPHGHYELYRANGQGFRASRDYSAQPPPGIVRIAAFGDSFTHGDDVANDETWPERLAQQDRRLEVINGGVGGYGPDQAWLRYQEIGAALRPHVVLIGCLSENIHRVVNVFRPFYYESTGLPLAKPRFVLSQGHLRLIPSPISRPEQYEEVLNDPQLWLDRLGAHDDFFQSNYAATDSFLPSLRLARTVRRDFLTNQFYRDGVYNPDSPAFRLLKRVLTGFYEEVLRDGGLPIILLFPHQDDIEYYRKHGEAPYQPLLASLASDGYRVVDIQPAFNSHAQDHEDVDTLIPSHYTPLANELVARHVWRFLERQGLTDVSVIQAKVAAEREER